MIGLALSLACLASSYLVQRRTPSHRPVTVALGVQAAVAALCLAPLPARVQMAACALLPVVSAWMYLRVWRAIGQVDGWIALNMWCFCVAVGVGGAPNPTAWWDVALPSLFAVSTTVGLVACWRSSQSRWCVGITQRVAMVSLVGDAALVAFAVARELAPWQARLVAVALLVVHVRWLVADRALRRSLSSK